MVVGKNEEAAIVGGQIDYSGGATFLVNKPLHWTSFDVVKKLRFAIKKKLNVKKVKVGHAGTLDPLAEGLLIICAGKHTKKIHEYQDMPKQYSGTLKLGAITATYDAEMEEEDIKSTDHIKEEEVRQAAKIFTGNIKQKPPMFSALKRQGQRLYKIARRGESVALPEREVEVYEFNLEKIDLPLVHFKVVCSKGTYIRSLAFDLGKELEVGGYLTSLYRDAIGPYKKEDAFEVEHLVKLINHSETKK